jgi:REP element-mobilizing transposase RayT
MFRKVEGGEFSVPAWIEKSKARAYVFMPSHVHLVVEMPGGQNISDLMRDCDADRAANALVARLLEIKIVGRGVRAFVLQHLTRNTSHRTTVLWDHLKEGTVA